MEVGIRELKAHLSEYVERAANGEVVRVTDRGVPRALLMPLPAGDTVRRGLEEGWVSRHGDKTAVAVTPVTPLPGRSTTELLDADRGD